MSSQSLQAIITLFGHGISFLKLANLKKLFIANKIACKLQLQQELNNIQHRDMFLMDDTLKSKDFCDSLGSINVTIDDDGMVHIYHNNKGEHKHPLSSERNVSKGLLDVVHLDAWDLAQNEKIGGCKYFITFIGDSLWHTTSLDMLDQVEKCGFLLLSQVKESHGKEGES